MRPLAAALKHPSHTTVQGWHDRDRVPVSHWAGVIQAASDLGVSLTAADFVPIEVREPGIAADSAELADASSGKIGEISAPAVTL
ncbi:carph-isopro domain-containing protein [Sphingomonas sp. PAMC 26605]|uniref:carph-isopro domain-containing protein n=1 Tax=Sphingomonas sp. PAMC 26605 TaxID=1112214 RepID=UPI003FA470EA